MGPVLDQMQARGLGLRLGQADGGAGGAVLDGPVMEVVAECWRKAGECAVGASC